MASEKPPVQLLIALCLSLLICVLGIATVPTSQGYEDLSELICIVFQLRG